MKVIQVVHDLSLGGVEEAVRSCFPPSTYDIEFKVYTINSSFNKEKENLPVKFVKNIFSGLNNPLSYIFGAASIKKEKPDVVVCSLWRSMLIGVILKLLRVKVVCFVHNEKYKHTLDKVFHEVALRLFDFIFVDSNAIKEKLAKENKERQIEVVSFKLRSAEATRKEKKRFSFIFWGRKANQKRLDRAISFFSSVVEEVGDACFVVIGPENEVTNSDLEEMAFRYNVVDKVMVHDKLSFDEIKEEAEECCFYLQLSDYEGMAMSVVEAMEIGLVPIVTPVGEVSNYVKDGVNGFFVDYDNPKSWVDVIHKIKDISNKSFTEVSDSAKKCMENEDLYKDSFSSVIKNLPACD